MGPPDELGPGPGRWKDHDAPPPGNDIGMPPRDFDGPDGPPPPPRGDDAIGIGPPKDRWGPGGPRRPGPPPLAESISQRLERAAFNEETMGDLDQALRIYGSIVDEARAARPRFAEAQYRYAECLLKKGEKDKAKAEFERLAREFPELKELQKKAEEKAAAIK